MKALADKPTPPPVMAMIDTSKGYRFYFLTPVPCDTYNPSISVIRGAIRPGYVIPNRLDRNSIYFEGSLKVCKKHHDLLGILAALKIMLETWRGVLASHPGAEDDLLQQQRLAEALTGQPEASYALIEKSGVLGNPGIPRCARHLVRNVLALAHWGAIRKLRHARNEKTPRGLHWEVASDLINQICSGAFPDRKAWQLEDFTASTLKGTSGNVVFGRRRFSAGKIGL